MNKLNVAVIEDEKPASRLLISMLSRLRPDWNVKHISGSVSGSVKWFSENDEPGLMFLDIHLSDGDSFAFLERVKPSCPVIFTTAYDEYAIRAFSVNSIDYLLKPFDEKRLEDSVLKFESLHITNQPSDIIIDALKSINTKEKRYRTRFLINAGSNSSETLQVEDIAYFYSVNRISFAICKNGAERVVDLSLDKLGEQLEPDRFFRVNRQFILNIDSIKRIEPYFGGKLAVSVTPHSPENITVSKEKVPGFKYWLNF